MRVRLHATDLPGTAWDGHTGIRVSLQVGQAGVDPVPGDARAATWETELRLHDGDARGPAVHGRKGERFLYLRWEDDSGALFRRAKLMLADLPDTDAVVGHLSLTDAKGGPACARVPVRWEVS